eukprot:18736-Heterococcus_DN1.PRE.3
MSNKLLLLHDATKPHRLVTAYGHQQWQLKRRSSHSVATAVVVASVGTGWQKNSPQRRCKPSMLHTVLTNTPITAQVKHITGMYKCKYVYRCKRQYDHKSKHKQACTSSSHISNNLIRNTLLAIRAIASHARQYDAMHTKLLAHATYAMQARDDVRASTYSI